MLPRDRRLRRERDFSVIWRSRWVIRRPALTLRLVRVPASPGRIGFVVSKAVAKRAVVRNKVKRRLRAIMAHRAIPAGIDAALIVARPALDLTFQQLTRIVDDLLDQALASPPRARPH